MAIKKFVVNKQASGKKLVLCKTTVKRDNIRRENRDGIEHIVITSYTLPPNIIMNRGLYPEDVIESSFKTLERTLAPIEHPSVNGQYISAGDPLAIIEFFSGVWNENVEKVKDGRIKIDKVINVQEALKTERGRRLLDRVEGIEDGTDSRSIHTSVGAFVDMDVFDKPQTNADGEEYDWEATAMVFDHDAILLDSVGAATPDQGVGIGVNETKDGIPVEIVSCDKENDITINDMRSNRDISFDEIRDKLWHEINGQTNNQSWVVEVFNDYFVFENSDTGEMFRSSYTVDEDGEISIQDTRERVERVVGYRAINQPTNGDDDMRDKIIAKLKSWGISVNADISDEELEAEYEKALIANQGDGDADGDGNSNTTTQDESELTANQQILDLLKTQGEAIVNLQTRFNANADAEIDKKIKVIQANAKYDGFDEKVLKALATNNAESFEKMYTESLQCNNASSFGIGPTGNPNNSNENSYILNTKIEDLPE